MTFRLLHRGLDVIPERDRHIGSGAYDSAEPGYRVSATERIRGHIDELFALGRQLPEIVEEVARLGA